MKEISFLERLAENLLEGGFMRALKPRLQPVQLAKALGKEMTSSQMVGPDGPLVANRYSIYLSPRDFAQFASFQLNLERELASYLRGFSARRGFKPIAAISVELRQSEHLKAGQVRTEGVMIDVAPSSPPAGSEIPSSSNPVKPPEAGMYQGTMEMPVLRADPQPEQRALPAPSIPPAALISTEGSTIPLAGESTSIGRAIDNDVVLDARSVSRRHAQIRWESGRFVLEDLGSTNGTFASGTKVARHPIEDGEELSFGGVRFLFRQQGG